MKNKVFVIITFIIISLICRLVSKEYYMEGIIMFMLLMIWPEVLDIKDKLNNK